MDVYLKNMNLNFNRDCFCFYTFPHVKVKYLVDLLEKIFKNHQKQKNEKLNYNCHKVKCAKL